MRQIVFYKKDNGSSQIEEFLDGLSDNTAARTLAVFKYIQNEKRIPPAMFKKLSGYPLWEVRIKSNKAQYRYLGFFAERNTLVLVTAFVKKSKKTPRQHLNKTLLIRKNYLRR